jgi:hypothetical protein
MFIKPEEIEEKIYINFGVSLEKKYLFSEIQNVSENKITTAENNSILIIKNTDTIDIYLCKVSRGYIYNTKKLVHYYKFFINNHTFYEEASISKIPSPKLKAKLESRKIKHQEFSLRNDNLIKELKEKLEKMNIKS